MELTRPRPLGPALPVLESLPAPRRARAVARRLAAAFFAFTALCALSPWQQTVIGQGRVAAWSPDARSQAIEAPVSGRILRWSVREGDLVAVGQPLVELIDNDPQRLERMRSESEAARDQLVRREARVLALQTRQIAVEGARDAAVESARAKLREDQEKARQEQQKLAATEAELTTALLQLERLEALHQEGLASRRELELARLGEARALTGRDAARAALAGAEAAVSAAEADLARARSRGDDDVAAGLAALESAESDVASARAALLAADGRLARQEAQAVTSPAAGRVLRLHAPGSGEQVKEGDPLLTVVPVGHDGVAELIVDGNDASLVREGDPVRLQFEGWPAVQFAGWPSVAVGTFGGVVRFVDAASKGSGDFRVVVGPDPADDPWPEDAVLRQGLRAHGWVLLRQVPLWYELWRRINGFPQARNVPSDGAAAAGKKR